MYLSVITATPVCVILHAHIRGTPELNRGMDCVSASSQCRNLGCSCSGLETQLILAGPNAMHGITCHSSTLYSVSKLK